MSYRRLRIVHVINSFEPGGAEAMLCSLLARCDRDRFEPSAVSLIDDLRVASPVRDAGIAIDVIGMRPGIPDPRGIWRLARTLKRLEPDVIHTWMDHSNLIGGLAAKLAGRPPVVWSVHHSDHVAGLTKRSTLLTVNACGRLSRMLPSRIIFCSEHGQAMYCDRHRFDAERSVGIPNGVDTGHFEPQPAVREEVRRELDLAPDDFVVGLVARYDPLKDHATFLKAASLLADRSPAARFVLCGAGVDANNDALCSQIDVLGLRSRCRLLGLRRDVPRLFAAIDVACSSSLSEAFPLVIVEAMSCGLPAVVTDVGDSARMVGPTGRVVPPNDATALAAAWGELLAAGPAARAQLGHAARQRVREHYDLDVVTRAYESLYVAVAAECSGTTEAALCAPMPVGGGQ